MKAWPVQNLCATKYYEYNRSEAATSVGPLIMMSARRVSEIKKTTRVYACSLWMSWECTNLQAIQRPGTQCSTFTAKASKFTTSASGRLILGRGRNSEWMNSS